MMNNINRPNGTEKQEKSLAEMIDSFLNGFKKFWWTAVILMIIGGLFGYFNYKRSYVPSYQSEATFSITAPEYDGTDQSYTNNSQLAANLSVSFDYLINNEVFYEIIKEDIGISYIPCTITVSAVQDTNILSIVVAGSDAEMNLKVINSVMENYSGVAEFVLGDTKLTVLEQPTKTDSPLNPYSPIKSIFTFMFIGFVLGLIPSVIYALFIKTIKSKEDIEQLLSVSCFGALPMVMMNQRDKELESCSVLNKNVGFRYLEAMRSINSRCEKELKKRNCKVILVTSTADGEGKSTFAMNLAYSLSKSQNKVMLIDGDLRKPSLRNLTKIETVEYSMDDFINKDIKSSQAIVNIKGTRVLVLAPDKPTKNPIECLNSENMAKFVEECNEIVDYTIIDAPTCNEFSDAAVLAKYSDGIIYVVKEDTVKVNKILDAIQEFSYTKKPIIGSVLNGTSGRLKLSYGYGYGKRYGYGYRKAYGKSYGRYGYGRYGYGGYGYGDSVYGEVSDKEFRTKERSISKKISMTTTKEQKEALEKEKQALALEEPEEKPDENKKAE